CAREGDSSGYDYFDYW
nr:immunoglobulin heavy chain junction region [Mus musculus]NSM04053.1 immunoglobulin heavy chain junction region [Mus musculus]NSM04564.1 immunoglobulin heavy chain junction region [Mus musculus]NSM04690.1 immunoglobulin heavy chain junction region [Mus musculus]NSM05224.1 immunoglobulin heavy chain junction region [Mus musculus]